MKIFCRPTKNRQVCGGLNREMNNNMIFRRLGKIRSHLGDSDFSESTFLLELIDNDEKVAFSKTNKHNQFKTRLCENHTLLMTIMAKINTLFMTKNLEKPYPFALQKGNTSLDSRLCPYRSRNRLNHVQSQRTFFGVPHLGSIFADSHIDISLTGGHGLESP